MHANVVESFVLHLLSGLKKNMQFLQWPRECTHITCTTAAKMPNIVIIYWSPESVLPASAVRISLGFRAANICTATEHDYRRLFR